MVWESAVVVALVGQFLVAYLIFYYSQYFLRKQKCPPGPTPLPLVGNLIEVATAHPIGHLAIHELSKRYGSFYQIRIGPTDTVILASLKACKAILNNDAALGRDLSGLIKDRSLGQNIGFAFATGEQWKVMRSWAMKNLKTFGLGSKLSVESITNGVSEDLIDGINEFVAKDKIFDINLAFNMSTVKIIWEAMTGQKILKDDKQMHQLIKDQDACIKSNAAKMALIGTYPPLRHIFPGLLGYNVAMKFYMGFAKVGKQILQEEVVRIGNSISSLEPTNLVEAYIRQAYIDRDQPQTLFTEDNFAVMLMDLFQGGSETTSALIEWIVLYLARDPEKQRKLHEEIDRVLPNMERCSLSHKAQMIYTQAVILETHRHAHILPNGVPRRATADIEYDGLIIRKGCNILVDFHTINFDPSIWGSDAHEFLPERFIGEQGKIVNGDKFLPFSYGRRNCPGDTLTETVSFLLVVNLFQRFAFYTIPESPLPIVEPVDGFSCRPHPFKVVVMQRNLK